MLAVLNLAGCNRPNLEELYRQSRASLERGELVQAEQEAERGLDAAQNKNAEWNFRFRVLKAEVVAWQGKPKDSLALLANSPPPFLAGSEAALRRLIVLGTADYLMRQFDDSAKTLDQAEKMAASKYPSFSGDVAMAEATLATYRQNYANAEHLNLEALDFARREKRRYLEARALGSLGFMSLRKERYGEAIDWFTPSLTLSREMGNKTLAAKTLGNLGWCYFKLGDYERAADNFEQAEQLSSQLGLAKDEFLWLTNIGSVHYQARDYVSAANYYQQALAIARRLDNKPGIAACLSNLAATALESQQYDIAEGYNREAMLLKQATGDKSSELYSVLNAARIAAGRKQYPQARAFLNRIVADSGEDISLRWEAESQLADVLVLEGDNAGAEVQFRKALATIDQARASVTKEEYRLSFLGSADRFYNDYVDFLVSRKRPRAALRITEHSRARTLSEGLKLPLDKMDQGSFHFEQTARKLHAVILSYWLKPGKSYLWAVTSSGVAIYTLPDADKIDAQMSVYRKTLIGPRDPKDIGDANGIGLYRALVEPAQKLIPNGSRVIVVGSEGLNGLNFSTLLVPEPRLHYWIEDVAVADANSIALLSGSYRPHRAVPATLLLIGNPVYRQGDYSELKQAQLEVKEVSQHFSPDRRTVLEGVAATPGAYASSGPARYSHIHFVAHGTASRTSPLDSSIILALQGEQSKLYARDVIQQHLRAELVTISACYGAGARSYSGEGLVGLSWAFLRAGARHVVAALWEVSDNSTPHLMDAMYTKLQENEDPVLALRSAQLAMLNSGTVYRRAFYWGTFQIYSGPQ